jgi:hypothetical protein
MHTHGDYLPHGHSLKHLLCESDVANGVEVAGATGTVNAGVDGRDVVAAVPFILVPSRSLMLTTIAREGVGGVPVGFAREGPRLEARRPCPPDAAASTAGCLPWLAAAPAGHGPSASLRGA